jgi:hypothetical protein
MSKEDFTNNEILLMFKEIKTTLERVEAQVIKTNGRVTLLEMWKEGLMAKIAGVIATISFVWIAFKEIILNK